MLQRYLLILILILLPRLLFAQSENSGRPKIAYVLSGGGAKGMAHVGVLKVLEEVGLQPDYITGTSMGSIMGGLYSIGYSAEEISHIIETIDWRTVLTNEIPANQVIIRRKEDYSKFIMEMPVYNGKPELPSGLIEGQKLSELFSNLTWRQAGVNDFNELPTPFVCIGTDILKGGKVEMNSGDLSSAMRASMAIPSVFTPVIRDSIHILVDGGVVRNFPVQEAIDMGADIIIGVYVGFDSQMEPEQLRSLTSVITRTSLLSGAAGCSVPGSSGGPFDYSRPHRLYTFQLYQWGGDHGSGRRSSQGTDRQITGTGRFGKCAWTTGCKSSVASSRFHSHQRNKDSGSLPGNVQFCYCYHGTGAR